MLTLYNSLTNQKEPFEPLDPPVVRMYNCGPTVYQYAHIGNLRAFVFADTLRRALRHSGFTVDQVMNITDVGHLTNDDTDSGDDKIEREARKQHKTAAEIAQFYTDAFFSDLHRLHIDIESIRFPRATDQIAHQIAMIKQLEEKGVTYQTTDGVYFDTATAADYPRLGTVDTAGMQEGARVDVNTEKRQPADFALWKFADPANNRLQEWDSPWGRGFPGWHIECSAMATEFLGPTIDIHTGGIDLQFPHHANEIVQTETATDKPFARFWVHSQHVSLKGAKMAKSDGNIITLSDLADQGIHPLAYRYWLLTAHYRSPISFDVETVKGVQTALRRLADQLSAAPHGGTVTQTYAERVTAACNNDLDTPRMIATLWEVTADNNLSDADRRATAEHILALLGIDISQLGTTTLARDELPDEVAQLVQEREEARQSQNFDRADELRDQIYDAGYQVEDTSQGPQLTPANNTA